jgi:2-keto-4-pentenoate hydratase/2-oxohepta-3-ene-1,7-dioic acid hydratase in catechol pathway
MKLATFNYKDPATGSTICSIGKVADGLVIDLALACPDLPRDMIGLLSQGEAALARVRVLEGKDHPRARRSLHEITLQPPVTNPRKFLAAGGAYGSHLEEIRRRHKDFKPPAAPVFFNKQVTCLQAPGGPIELPRVSDKLDYEVELLVVIARRCRGVRRDDAHEVIAGYCVSNDVTVRDWQIASPTMTVGKSFDTHGPIGPWITTPDEARLADGLWLRTYVNGELRQDGNTRDMILPVGEQIEYLSTAFTLEPGDLIATGTPAGVGILMDPPQFLRVGDIVRCEIERLGYIENTVTRQ